MKSSLFWRVFLCFAAVIVFLAGALALLAPRPMRDHHIQEQSVRLEGLAALLEERISPFLEEGGAGDLESYVRTEGRKAGVRITVIDASGKVLAESEQDPQEMESHRYRPEILAALEGAPQTSIRYSSTLKTDMLYMSFPIRRNGRIVGVLRLSLFMKDLDLLMAGLRASLLRTIGAVMALALLAAVLFTRSVTGPVREFVAASAKVASGDFNVKLSTRRQGEFKTFAESFNVMTAELKEAFGALADRKEELDAILTSIGEGLSVLDKSGAIVLSNEAFRRLTGNDAPDGRFYWEVVRNSRLTEIVRKAQEARRAESGELILNGKVCLCNAVLLPSQDRIVLTLHDITPFREVERIKREFVMNVSHELKTPLTAIKGFAETLESDLRGESLQYLRTIERNTDRLIRIVDDLLVLSALEEKGPLVDKESVDLRPLAEHILRIFEPRAKEKGISLELDAPATLPALQGDPTALESLLLNLVDNGLKYTEKGSVRIRLRSGEGSLVLEVADTGIGIPEEEIPRIFERFYVVDKSRSKKLGGTGLGLSIVKHIVLAHQGTVSVRSRFGEGSVFTIVLPLPPTAKPA